MTRRLRRRRRWLLQPIVAAAATISLAGLILSLTATGELTLEVQDELGDGQ